MHRSLQIMFILPLMAGHLFWKAIILGGLYRRVPLYFQLLSLECNPNVIPIWIGNHMLSKVLDEITYPIPKLYRFSWGMNM